MNKYTNIGLNVTNLAHDGHDDGNHSILFGKALEGHVPGWPLRADEQITAGRLKYNVLHIWPNPAIRLTKHGFRPQSRSHQKSGLAFKATVHI